MIARRRFESCRRAELSFRAQRFKLLGHRRANPNLRVGRWLIALAFFALVDALPRNIERRFKRVRARESALKQRLAEKSRIAAVAAAERYPVGLRRGDHQRSLVLQRLDVAARKTCRDDDDAPADAGVVQLLVQARGCMVDERLWRWLCRKPVAVRERMLVCKLVPMVICVLVSE